MLRGGALDHFLNRVEPQFHAFLRRKTEANALAAAVALWEMRDWLLKEADQKNVDKQQFTDALGYDFKLIRDLAELSKHRTLDRTSVEVVGISGTGSIGGIEYVTGPLGTVQSVPECTLTVDVKNGT